MPSTMKSIDSHFMLAMLNEVLNGFRVQSFNEEIGVSEEYLRSFGRKMSVVSHKPAQPIELAEAEAKMMSRITSLTRKELEEEEFQTRTGYDFAVGEAVARHLA